MAAPHFGSGGLGSELASAGANPSYEDRPCPPPLAQMPDGPMKASGYPPPSWRPVLGHGVEPRPRLNKGAARVCAPLQSRPGSGAVTIRSVPVSVANKLMEAGHQYLDVRSEENFKAGHARGAVNVPYLHSTLDGLTKNRDILAEVAARFAKTDNILVEDMVMDIDGGFAAWRDSSLPTEAPQLQQE
eukprot:SM000298S10945  [mRNA]  locus=s298:86238:87659:+ [translate_table: standard]